jgi:hypothetical protein
MSQTLTEIAKGAIKLQHERYCAKVQKKLQQEVDEGKLLTAAEHGRFNVESCMRMIQTEDNGAFIDEINRTGGYPARLEIGIDFIVWDWSPNAMSLLKMMRDAA